MYKRLILPLILLISCIPQEVAVLDISMAQEPRPDISILEPTPVPSLPEPVVPFPTIVPFSYTLVQTTFLEAKSAKIYQLEGKVRLQVEDLEPEQKPGLILTLKGVTEPILEVTTLVDFNGMTVGLYPPRFIKPDEPDTYIILGNPGDRYGIRARTVDGIEQIFAEIKGKPKPVPTDPVDPPKPLPTLDALTKSVSMMVTTINDPVTQAAIKGKLESLVQAFPAELDLAKSQTKAAIMDGLLESMSKLPPPYKDWKNGFRIPIDNELSKLGIVTASQMQQAVIAITKGM